MWRSQKDRQRERRLMEQQADEQEESLIKEEFSPGPSESPDVEIDKDGSDQSRKQSYRIDHATKRRIVALHKKGLHVSHIAEELGITKSTANLWVNRWKQEGSLESHKSKGRNKKNSTTDDQRIIETIRARPNASLSSIAKELKISVVTVRRRLKAANITGFRSAKLPQLTPYHKSHRLEFAQKYLNYDFAKVVFVDEKVISVNAQGYMTIWRLGERSKLKTDCVTFWGWMCTSGHGEVIEVPTGINYNAETYKNILGNVLIPSVKSVFGDEKLIFVQDSNPVHNNSPTVQNWLAGRNDVESIRLPAKSPDMNPMDDVWGMIGQSWNSQEERSVDRLREFIFDMWKGFVQAGVCKNSVSMLHNRLALVIKKQGGFTV